MAEFKRTFIITSVIFFAQKKVAGSSIRSVFSPEERMTQTAQTISSIRTKAPGSFIILLEMGNERNIGQELVNGADKYLYVGKHPWVRRAVNSKLRGLGEAVGLTVLKNELFTGTDLYFKISGRYYLNDHFDINEWVGNFFFAKKYENGISTRLYGFDKFFFNDWQKALKRSLLKLYLGHSIEDVLPAKFGRDRIHALQTLGLSGFIAPDGSYLEE